MNIVTFLEKMANSTHHSSEMNELIFEQSSQVQKAFLANDADVLKKEISNLKHYADNITISF